MAKSNAQRQAEYRARRRDKGYCLTSGCYSQVRKYRYCKTCRQTRAEDLAFRPTQGEVDEMRANYQNEIDDLYRRIRELESGFCRSHTLTLATLRDEVADLRDTNARLRMEVAKVKGNAINGMYALPAGIPGAVPEVLPGTDGGFT